MSNCNFFYEHIGHMQISILTLRTFEGLQILTGGEESHFVSWLLVRKHVEKHGFSLKQAESELERFCYGFECKERISDKGIREIALTKIGTGFLRNLLIETPYQASQLAFLMRSAKRKNLWNTIIQESTFFKPQIYELISQYKFRKGPARDYLRSISISELSQLVKLIGVELSPINSYDSAASIQDCIAAVESNGKYWASVGGKYSWFVFWQHFELDFSEQDWELYGKLLSAMIRPPEWGGGHDLSYNDVIELLEDNDAINKFYNNGIIRPLWKTKNIKDALFRLTAPGYLMWERKKKGPICEWLIRKYSEDIYELALCDAFDLNIRFNNLKPMNNQNNPGLKIIGDLNTVINEISLVNEQMHLF